jgi:SMC interacting uncharacterized protein involved in chromosome segregation
MSLSQISILEKRNHALHVLNLKHKNLTKQLQSNISTYESELSALRRQNTSLRSFSSDSSVNTVRLL